MWDSCFKYSFSKWLFNTQYIAVLKYFSSGLGAARAGCRLLRGGRSGVSSGRDRWMLRPMVQAAGCGQGPGAPRCKEEQVFLEQRGHHRMTWARLPEEALLAWEAASERSAQRRRWEEGSDQCPQFHVWSQQRWQIGPRVTSSSGKPWGALGPWVADGLCDRQWLQGGQLQWWGWCALGSWASSYLSFMHSFHMPARLCSKSFKLDFSSMWTDTFQMYKLGLEKAG